MIALIMAGGTGTRFWPRSRMRQPKQFLPLLGEKSFLEETVARIDPMIPADRILVITGAPFVESVRKAFPAIPAENILGEPVGRNTAPCIALAAAVAERRWGLDEVMAVLPADHHIADRKPFVDLLWKAAEACSGSGALVTLGIRPSRPETGYGYLEIGEEWKEISGTPAYRVNRFVEKPDRKRAEEYAASSKYLWNSGMFLWTVGAIREELEKHLPELKEAMDAFREGEPSDLPALLTHYFPRMPSVSIDYGVMEKAEEVIALPAEFPWNDVGSWEALSDLIVPDNEGNYVIGDFLGVDSGNCVIHSPRKLVAAIGVRDLVVVETDDALLICPRDRAQDVRAVVERLREEERLDYL